MLAEALGAIHAAGVVHRDLKPANVLLLDGDPVLVDFGIAHLADETRITLTGLVMGTPGYLSPEIVGGWPVLPGTDWWGWGSTLAFAASGRSPFGSGPVEVVLDRVRQGRPDLAGVDPRLARVLAAALTPDPARRPAGPALVAMLRAAGRAPAASPQTAVLPDPVPARFHPPAPVPAAMALPVTRATYPSPSRPGPPPASGPASRPGTQVLRDPADAFDPPSRCPAGARGVARRVAAGTAPSAAGAARLPPRPRRVRPRDAWSTAVLLGLLAALAGVATVAPGAVAVAFVVLAVLARTIDRSVAGLWRRRTERDGAPATRPSPCSPCRGGC